MIDPSLRRRESDANRLFAEYNRDYFNGRLPPYRVQLRQRIPVGQIDPSGHTNRQGRLIQLQANLDSAELVGVLLHEMAHAATNDCHGPRWRAEMRRLRDAEAPVSPEDLVDPIGRPSKRRLSPGVEEILRSNRSLSAASVAAALVRDGRVASATSGRALLQQCPWVRALIERVRADVLLEDTE